MSVNRLAKPSSTTGNGSGRRRRRSAVVLRATVAAERLALMLVAVASSGCYVFMTGYGGGVPPLRASAGVAGYQAHGDAPSHDVRSDVRIGVYPSQVVAPLARRPLDAGVGYLLQPGAPSHQAGFLELSVPLLREGNAWRLSAGAQLRLENAGGPLGYGGAVQLLAERLSFVRSTGCAARVFVTGARGDFGYGLFTEGAAGWIAGTHIQSATFGISFRLPAAGLYTVENHRCERASRD
jgi:hypothetical protein